MLKRLIAIVFIFGCTAVAWSILGSTVVLRTEVQDRKMKGAVSQLWGTVQTQRAPTVHYCTQHEVQNKRIEGGKTIAEIEIRTIVHPVALRSSQIDAGLSLQHRQKGLLWYSTYSVNFGGQYSMTNDTAEPHEYFVEFTFPTQGAVYDDFRFSIDGKLLEELAMSSGSVKHPIRLAPGQTAKVEIRYKIPRGWTNGGTTSEKTCGR
jgi:hypothetical protein